VGCFGGHGMPKVSQEPGEPGQIPLETERVVIAEWPERLKACVEVEAAILSDIIINENLKLLHINYLAQKVDVLFNFISRSHCTCNRTSGKT